MDAVHVDQSCPLKKNSNLAGATRNTLWTGSTSIVGTTEKLLRARTGQHHAEASLS